MTLNKNRGCLEKVTCLKYVILPWLLARLRPYAGFLSIIFFLCNAEDSSYETSPDEWYVIRPFITQKLVPYLSLIKYFFFSQRKFALLLRYRVIPLRYNARPYALGWQHLFNSNTNLDEDCRIFNLVIVGALKKTTLHYTTVSIAWKLRSDLLIEVFKFGT